MGNSRETTGPSFIISENSSEYGALLKAEFNVEEGSFLIKLRTELRWDTQAFSRLIASMEACAAAHSSASQLPRWIAEGFWYCSWFIKEWSSHPNFPKELDSTYYSAAYERLNDLAYWLFVGEDLDLDNQALQQAKSET